MVISFRSVYGEVLPKNTGGLCTHKREKDLVLRRWRLIVKVLDDKHFKTTYSFFRPPSIPTYALSLIMGV